MTSQLVEGIYTMTENKANMLIRKARYHKSDEEVFMKDNNPHKWYIM